MNYLLVGIGGMIGSIGRYAVASMTNNLSPNHKFPFATCIVNLVGCFLVGLIAGWIEKLAAYNSELRLLLITGVLGGFTTFSAFGLETLNLIREGSLVIAALYASVSVLGGFMLVYLGLRISMGG